MSNIRSAAVGNTGLMTLVWKERARKPDFWKEVTAHGHATREKPLFKDDIMSFFIDEEALESAKKLDPKLALAIAVRHKYFLQEISKTIKDNHVKQIILLGGGYDTRSVRKKKYCEKFGVTFFEVDQAEVLNRKKQIYQKNNIDPNATYVGIDYLKENLIAHLKAAGLDLTIPTHIIWEGNIFYLTNSETEKVLTVIKEAFKATVFISLDYKQEIQRGDACELTDLKQKLASANAAMKSDIKDFKRDFVNKIGLSIFSHTTCSEATKAYGVGDKPYVSQDNYYLCTLKK